MATEPGVALRNPLVKRNLLSEVGMTMAVNIRIRPEVTRQASKRYVAEQIDSTIAPLQHELQQVFQIGTPYAHQIITDRIDDNQRNILPLPFLILFLTLILMLRRANGALIPLVATQFP